MVASHGHSGDTLENGFFTLINVSGWVQPETLNTIRSYIWSTWCTSRIIIIPRMYIRVHVYTAGGSAAFHSRCTVYFSFLFLSKKKKKNALGCGDAERNGYYKYTRENTRTARLGISKWFYTNGDGPFPEPTHSSQWDMSSRTYALYILFVRYDGSVVLLVFLII